MKTLNSIIAIILMAASFAAAAQQRVAPTTVEVVPSVDLRYLQAGPEQNKTVCLSVDATKAGGPAIANAVTEAISAQLKEGGFVTVTEGCYISLQIVIPQGVRELAGYVDAQGTANASMRRSFGSFATFGMAPGIFEKSAPAAPPYVLMSHVQIMVGQGSTPAMVSVVASAPGSSPDQALPILQAKLGEGVAGILVKKAL